MFKATKRFIAGAVCPKCAAEDRIQAYKEEGVQYRECVECGFKERENFGTSSQRPLATRVSDGMEDVEAQPINLIDPKSD